MLFEKVPGLYGSGVVPTRFAEFKGGIRNLMMEQFFTPDNIERFLSGGGDTSLEKQQEACLKLLGKDLKRTALVNDDDDRLHGHQHRLR